jgi:hypothetical protein
MRNQLQSKLYAFVLLSLLREEGAFVLLSLLREEGAKKSLPETLSGQNFAARANGATVNSGDYSSFSRDQYYCF